MLPDHVSSTEVLGASFAYPRNIPKRPLIDYEYGGVAINDASQGLRYHVWRAEYAEGWVVLSAPGVPPIFFLELPGAKDFSLAFDQNMRPALAFELLNGESAFYWYNNVVGGYETLTLPGAITPRCALDDNRSMQVGSSDIILAYCRGDGIYWREQRDRFTVEYLLDTVAAGFGLLQIGMNNVWRFQFQVSTSSA